MREMGRPLSSASRRCRLLLSASFNLLRPFPKPQLYGASRLLETLAYEEIRVSERPLNSTAFVLHGLLGSARNWRTFSRNLASELQKSSPSKEWRMVLTDLRNHGRSTEIKGLDPPHDMANAARDLANLVKFHEWEWPDVIIGHSMGGKIALDFAASCGNGDYGESAVLPKQAISEIVKRWSKEVQEAIQSRAALVRFHALALLHQIRQNDHLAPG